MFTLSLEYSKLFILSHFIHILRYQTIVNPVDTHDHLVDYVTGGGFLYLIQFQKM